MLTLGALVAVAGIIAAASHLNFALSNTLKCLKPTWVKTQLPYVDRVMIVNGKAFEVLDTKLLGQTVGAILVEPSRKAQVVFAEAGPSTLQYLMPRAAGAYWNSARCSTYGP